MTNEFDRNDRTRSEMKNYSRSNLLSKGTVLSGWVCERYHFRLDEICSEQHI